MFVSYAQNFEDVILWRALGHLQRGCYVDVGACHPRLDSVSRAFYDRGWRGVHVEPVPHFAALLRADRPDELVLEAAVAELAGTRTLQVLPDTGLSTFDATLAARHQQELGFASHEITVPTLTLDQVFDAAGQPQTHWLKIDVEGAETAVLQGWDKSRFRPWVVVVEATIPNTQTDDSARWEPLLVEGGYQFVHFDGLNRWYVREENADLAAALRVPPNCFDGFVRAREVEAARERDELAGQLTVLRNELAIRQQTHAEQQARLDAHLEDSRREIERLGSELAGRERQLHEQLLHQRDLALQFAAAQSETAQAAQRLAEREQQLRDQFGERERDLAAQLHELSAALAQASQTAEARQQELTERERAHADRLEALHADWRAAEAEQAASHEQKLNEMQAQIAAELSSLQRSRWWRLGARLGWLPPYGPAIPSATNARSDRPAT
jgi:FkbM family methyltransferase